MTGKYGLAKKPVLMGLSREGLTIARWAAANPGKASCLYMDKAVCDFKSWPRGKSANDWASLLKAYNFRDDAEALAFKENPADLAPKLIADKVANIYVTGGKDDWVPYSENGALMERQYKELGGVFELITRPEVTRTVWRTRPRHRVH